MGYLNKDRELFRSGTAYDSWLNAFADIMERLDNMDVDDDIEREEIEGFKSSLLYIDEAIKNLDATFYPSSQLRSIYSVIMNELPNAALDLTTLNTVVDKLLTYLKPTIKFDKNYLNSLNATLKEVRETNDKVGAEYRKCLDFINKEKEEIYQKFVEIEKILAGLYDVDGRSKDLLINEALEKAEAYEESLEKTRDEIEALNKRLNYGADSVATQIEVTVNSANEAAEKVSELESDIEGTLEDIRDFHFKIYGGEDSVTGAVQDGMLNAINEHKRELSDYAKAQQQTYEALVDRIRELLPEGGAAGLATAFQNMRTSFKNTIRINTGLFVISILAICGVYTYQLYSTTSLVVSSDLNSIFVGLLKNLPITLPLIWLAVFASKRRSEAKRLEQEYAHKEALAKSYLSFKKQVDELDSELAEPLTEKLLASAILAISENPSSILGDKHGDLPPHQMILESLSSVWKRDKGDKV